MVKKNNSKPKAPKKNKGRTINKKKSQPKYRSFKLQKKIEVDSSHILTGPQLVGRSFEFVVHNWKILGKITLLYLVFYVLFIRVAQSFSVGDTREVIDIFFPNINALVTDTALVGIVIGSSVAVGGLNTVVGLTLMIFTSLALIRAIRVITNGEKLTLRDSFYNGMSPLIPFLLLILLLIIQLMPFVLGGLLYFAVVASGIVVGFMEQILFLVIWLALSILSAYWISNTVMAMYAVTIPGTYPLKVHRATSRILRHKRFVIFRRILFLIVMLLLLNGGLILIAIIARDGLAYHARDFAAVISLPLAHVYLYKLYRSIL